MLRLKSEAADPSTAKVVGVANLQLATLASSDLIGIVQPVCVPVLDRKTNALAGQLSVTVSVRILPVCGYCVKFSMFSLRILFC